MALDWGEHHGYVGVSKPPRDPFVSTVRIAGILLAMRTVRYRLHAMRALSTCVHCIRVCTCVHVHVCACVQGAHVCALSTWCACVPWFTMRALFTWCAWFACVHVCALLDTSMVIRVWYGGVPCRGRVVEFRSFCEGWSLCFM